jgi:hypothetical protein
VEDEVEGERTEVDECGEKPPVLYILELAYWMYKELW